MYIVASTVGVLMQSDFRLFSAERYLGFEQSYKISE